MLVEEESSHVLMVSAALQGHLNPLLKFAKCLISKGIRVTIATTEVARHRMLKHASTTASPSSIQLEFFSDGLDPDYDRESDYGHWLDIMGTKGSENLSNLIAKLAGEGTKFSYMILHQFVPWFIPVAKENDLPCAVLWIQPCALYSIYYRFFNKLNEFTVFNPPHEPLELPGLPLLALDDIPTFILPTSNWPCFEKLLQEFFSYLDDVKWVLGTSFSELEEEVLKSMSGGVVTPMITPVGPLVSPFLLGKEEEKGEKGLSVDMWKADESCLRWLDGQEAGSVVYVSFGSIILLSMEQVKNMATGLLNSGKPFLWVFKRASNVQLPDGFLEAVAGRGLVVDWCSQEQVLTHNAVGCFLTHCGWNSTLETVVAGVPVIAFPEWTDQPTNAKLLTDVFKMGVRMKKGEDGIVSSKEVERCIKEITDGPAAEAMAKRAVELMEAGKRAVEDGGSSHRNLELFIADIVGKKMARKDHANDN